MSVSAQDTIIILALFQIVLPITQPQGICNKQKEILGKNKKGGCKLAFMFNEDDSISAITKGSVSYLVVNFFNLDKQLCEPGVSTKLSPILVTLYF